MAIERAGKSLRCRGETKGWSGLTVKSFLEDEDMLVRILDGEFDNPGENRPPPTPTVFFDPDNTPLNDRQPPMQMKTPKGQAAA